MENFKFNWIAGTVAPCDDREYLVRLKLVKGGSEVYDVAKYVSGVWAFPYNRRAFPEKWEWHEDGVGTVVAYAELPPAPTVDELQSIAIPEEMEDALPKEMDAFEEFKNFEADDE